MKSIGSPHAATTAGRPSIERRQPDPARQFHDRLQRGKRGLISLLLGADGYVSNAGGIFKVVPQ